MPEGDYLCEGVTKLWYPASRDLAYMLFEVAVSVKSGLGDRSARRIPVRDRQSSHCPGRS